MSFQSNRNEKYGSESENPSKSAQILSQVCDLANELQMYKITNLRVLLSCSVHAASCAILSSRILVYNHLNMFLVMNRHCVAQGGSKFLRAVQCSTMKPRPKYLI